MDSSDDWVDRRPFHTGQNVDRTMLTEIPRIRRINVSDLNWALAQGWKDFYKKRGDLVVLGLLYPIICFVAAVVTLNGPLLPLFFPLVAGLSIAGPAAASGFYELARRRGEAESSTWRHFFDPLRDQRLAPLAILTAGLALLFLGWLVTAYALYAVSFGAYAPENLADFLARIFSTAAGWRLIIFGSLAGVGFAVVTLVVSLVSFPMVIDKPVKARMALRTSIAAARKNPGEVLGWGLRVALLLFVGLIPLAIGLAVVLPWLGYSTWHLYTRLVVR